MLEGHHQLDELRALSTCMTTPTSPTRWAPGSAAGCLAGLCAHYSAGRGWLEAGDLQAAEAPALRSGDSGHGPGWRRAQAFESGYYGSTLTPGACGLE